MRTTFTTRIALFLAAVAAIVVLGPAAAGAATTINVDASTEMTDELNNDGDCSIREAVQAANVDSLGTQTEQSCEAGTDNDTIQVPAGTYLLQIADDVTPGIEDGDLDVNDSDGETLKIIGAGRSNTRINANAVDRVLRVVNGDLTVQALSLQGGLAQSFSFSGGGILAQDAVTLVDAMVASNDAGAGGSGGGIQMTSANLTLSNSTVEMNESPTTGGGINLSGGASVVANSGTLINQNTATFDGGGINNGSLSGGDITINAGASVQNNDAVANGGGINHNTDAVGADLIINGGIVTGNDVMPTAAGSAAGGGIQFRNLMGGQLLISNGATITNNTATGAEATGGGIRANVAGGAPSISITGSTISGNGVTVPDESPDDPNATLEGGGGISLAGSGPTVITSSTVGPNNTVSVTDPDDTATGAGILGSDAGSGPVTIDRSLVAGNTLLPGASASRQGGGLAIYNATGSSGILNSTFSGNDGGAIGGAIVAPNAHPLTIAHATFAQNVAVTGAALNFFGGGGPAYTIRGSLFDQPGMNPACIPNPLVGVNAYNVDAGDSCVGTNPDTDLRNATTNLGPLADNGGPTLTHALLIGPDSQAINYVPTSSFMGPQCLDLNNDPLTVDQRGRTRPFPAPPIGPCDAGAYELGDIDGDGIFDTFDACPNAFGPPPGCPLPATNSTSENPECETLRQKIKKLSRKIKRAEDPDQKAKLKKKRRKARKQLAALGCAS